jgi:hypothetical protein
MAPAIAGAKLSQAFLRKKRSWRIIETGPDKRLACGPPLQK